MAEVKDRDDIIERYRALGYSPKRAEEMADAAMIGTEAKYGQRNIENLTGQRGVKTPGRYGTYVAPSAFSSLAGGYQGAKSMMEQPGIFERGKTAARAGIESLAAGMGAQGGPPSVENTAAMEDANIAPPAPPTPPQGPPAPRVNALRNFPPQPGGTGGGGGDAGMMQPGATALPPRPPTPNMNVPPPQPQGARMQQNMPPGVNFDINDPAQMAQLERTNPTLAAKLREFQARGG